MKKKSRFIDFKQLKQEVPIKQILEHYELLDDLVGEGNALSGYCPVCEGEAEDLFRVSLIKNCWNCFGDCSGGNILDFVSQMEECTIREAAVKITEWFSIGCTAKKKRTSRKTAKKSGPQSNREESPPSSIKEDETMVNKPLGFALELDSQHACFDDLCLSKETVEEFGLGYCSKGYLKDHVAFPIHNQEGEVMAYGGIAVGNDDFESFAYKYPTEDKFNPSLELFGLHHALQRGQVDVIYWVRSPMDVFRAWHDDGISAVCLLSKPVANSLGYNTQSLVSNCLMR